ncbi:MAG: ABC transporter ATP-binding protein [Spirochaetota bacterium]
MDHQGTTPEASVEARALSKSYRPGAWALRDLSFELRAGEIVGLLGENGAGKTTTLRLLCSLLSPNSGAVCINGMRVGPDSPASRRAIGVMFGAEPGLYERLTGRENIEYHARLNGLTRAAASERADSLATMLGMHEYIDRMVRTYSSGMRQKTALARTVAHDPPILLFDEPTSGLDVSSTETVHDFLRERRAAGHAILLSSHRLDEVERLCDRLIVLHEGRMAASGTPRELALEANGDLRSRFLSIIRADR